MKCDHHFGYTIDCRCGTRSVDNLSRILSLIDHSPWGYSSREHVKMDESSAFDPQLESVQPVEAVGAATLDQIRLRLAVELAPARWRRSLRAWEALIAAGHPWEQCLAELRPRMPRELFSLCTQAQHTPRPSELLLRIAMAHREQQQQWQSFKQAIAYPLFLMYAAVVLAAVFNWSLSQMIELGWVENLQLDDAVGLINVQRDEVQAVWSLCILTLWLGAVGCCLRWLGPRWCLLAVVSGLGVVGRPVRHTALSKLLRYLALFLEGGIRPGELVPAVARSLQGTELEIVAQHVNRRVIEGMPLGEALAQSVIADAFTRPLLRGLDYNHPRDFSGVLHELSHALDRMADADIQMLRRVLPPLLIFLIVALMWGALMNYAATLVPLLRAIALFA
ncbi:MAG: hypothetical protein KatS3mg111_1630 [Pirellulaceae bacterium]|nr:MAG: hypothetical protein KatS3mg111_1630 [Pirellulaceae bacterium]